jgi:hypothetical protein
MSFTASALARYLKSPLAHLMHWSEKSSEILGKDKEAPAHLHEVELDTAYGLQRCGLRQL